MKKPDLTWEQLHLRAPVDFEVARAALVALATVPGSPFIVLQTIARQGRVSWCFGTSPEAASGVRRALAAHVPELRTERIRDNPLNLEGAESVEAFSVRFPGGDFLPLARAETSSVTRSLLAALAVTTSSESACVQVILGPPQRPRIGTRAPSQMRKDEVRRVGEHGFGCAVRLIASAATSTRAEHLARDLGGALGALASPGVRLHLRRAAPREVARARPPFLWPLWLAVSDLVPLLGWPTAPLPLAGIPSAHPRLLPPVSRSRGKTLGVSTTHPDHHVGITVEASLRHLHILGPTGVGKSTLGASLILQDIAAGRGVVVIDPKGDLVTDIAQRVPEERLDDVVFLDPTDPAPVGVGSLAGSPELAVDALLAVLHSLYADSWGPRSQDILHASLLSLAKWGQGTLVMVPSLLTRPAFRRRVLGSLPPDPLGLDTFWAWFEGISDAERAQVIAPLMNKLRPLTMRAGVRATFGQRQPRFAVGDVLSKRRILLVSLAKGALGPEAAELFGSIVVALVWQAIQQRSMVPANRRRPVTVMVDEVQDYLRLPGDLGDALAQARSLGAQFVLANQDYSQFDRTFKAAVMANVRSRVSFSLSPDDARTVAATTGKVLEAEDFRQLPRFHAYAQILTDGAVTPPVSITTQPLADPLWPLGDVRARSRTRYGIDRAAVDADLLRLIGDITTDSQASAEPLGRVRRARPAPTQDEQGGDR